MESLGWSEPVWEEWELLLCWLLPPSGGPFTMVARGVATRL